jgi:hypothetical protein
MEVDAPVVQEDKGMAAQRLAVMLVAAVAIMAAAGLSPAQEIAGAVTTAYGPVDLQRVDRDQGFCVSLGVRKYINSFTSYQFPDPGTPLNPISRLEWPWEQTYLAAKTGYAFRSFELTLDAACTASVLSSLKAQDSDWLDAVNPGQKIVFSDGKAKPRGWTVDLCTSVPLPILPYLKGVLGFRRQQFSFTYTDFLQSTIGVFDANDNFIGYAPVVSRDFAPGAGIEFTESYKHWYAGGIASRTFNLGDIAGFGSSTAFVLRFQVDLAYVTANNHDMHLLRGDRHTFENTRGSAWHVNLLAGLAASDRLRLEVEGDFIRISTTGSHQWVEPGTNQSWNGAKVWSDQAYVAMSGRYWF